MPEIIDLEMSVEEYLQLVEAGRDPVLEKLYERHLQRMRVLDRPGSLADQQLRKSQQRQVTWITVGSIGLLFCLLMGGLIVDGLQTRETLKKKNQTQPGSSLEVCRKLPLKLCPSPVYQH